MIVVLFYAFILHLIVFLTILCKDYREVTGDFILPFKKEGMIKFCKEYKCWDDLLKQPSFRIFPTLLIIFVLGPSLLLFEELTVDS